MIRKGGDKWCLYSKKKNKDGKRRKLGCYSSKKGAENREKQVKMFKHLKEEGIMKLSRQKLKEIIKEELDEMRGGGTGDSRLPVAAHGVEDQPDELEITKGKIRTLFVELSKRILDDSNIQLAEIKTILGVLEELIPNASDGNLAGGAARQVLRVALDKIDQMTGTVDSGGGI